jgi:Tetratricopeptide repeat
MGGGSRQHAELAEELAEWLGDLQQGMTSRVVLAAVPPGWGRTTVLNELAAAAEDDGSPVTLVARVSGRELPDVAGVQAAVLRECLSAIAARHRAVELLGLDRLSGVTQVGLGVGGLFISAVAAAIGFLIAGLAVEAAGKAWDDSPAGQDGALARTARAVAAESAGVPVLVIIDDADYLDEAVTLSLIDNLVTRHNGHVLVVAAVDPAGSLHRSLVSRTRQRMTGDVVRVAEANPDMGYAARANLALELCPHLPRKAGRRIARVTATYSEVFAVAAAPRIAEASSAGDNEAALLAVVDEVAGARLRGPAPSPEAVVAAWAGGLLHARQAARALAVLGRPRASDDDPDLVHGQGLERVRDPAAPQLAGEVAALARRDKAAMAALLADEALQVAADPECGLAERIAAAQAALRVRNDLTSRDILPAIQCQLVGDLENLGETAAALEVADSALREFPAAGSPANRDWLEAALLRLAHRAPGVASPAAAALIAEATARGAALGLESRVWAASELLRDPGRRKDALELTDQVAAALDEHASAVGTAADQWRLLLAFEAGRAGHPALAEHLLAPLTNCGDPQREDAAAAVLRAGAGPGADLRLQNIILEAELAALPPAAEDGRLRIHHALALNHHALGEYGQALAHGQQELALRISIQSPDHPDTLDMRTMVAYWTSRCGDTEKALRLFQELRPDQERILGPHHPDPLATRSNIAALTRSCGDAAGALRLYWALLPDQERFLGPYHNKTLATRSNITVLTGERGDAAGALRLSRKLLADQERFLGPLHPYTLKTRHDIAYWTGQSGDPASALRLLYALLPQYTEVLGPHHPDTLKIRSNIGRWTRESGDLTSALRLYHELLPDQERILGPHHPDAIETRHNIDRWTEVIEEQGRDY